MKNISLTNKLLLILSVFLLLVNVFTIYSFGFEFNSFKEEEKNTTYKVPDIPIEYRNYPYIIDIWSGNYELKVINDKNGYCCFKDGSKFRLYTIGSVLKYTCSKTATSWGSPDIITNTDNTEHSRFDTVIYCNSIIYTDINKSEVFFYPQQVVIPKLEEVTEIPKTMGKVLKILIPVGLIVFSIGFLIYLVRLVISRVT